MDTHQSLWICNEIAITTNKRTREGVLLKLGALRIRKTEKMVTELSDGILGPGEYGDRLLAGGNA